MSSSAPEHEAVGLISDFTSDVYWWEPDGRVLRLSPGDGIYSMACVHPSGDHAVFWGGATGRPRLWAADADGRIDVLTDGRSSARYPAYDLGGRVLVYCRSEHPSETIENLTNGSTATMPAPEACMAIVLMAADGQWERPLTDGAHLDQRPAISPDGSTVVFTSNRGGLPGLWSISTDGRGEPSPLLQRIPAYRPWWSVDGRWIYFVALDVHRHQVHKIRATGGRPIPLHNDDRGFTHGPYADPDGRSLIVHSTRDSLEEDAKPTWRLYELPLDGSPPRPLSPPGFSRGAHGTRARNGVMAFDVSAPLP